LVKKFCYGKEKTLKGRTQKKIVIYKKAGVGVFAGVYIFILLKKKYKVDKSR
jgi:hypothetical protein